MSRRKRASSEAMPTIVNRQGCKASTCNLRPLCNASAYARARLAPVTRGADQQHRRGTPGAPTYTNREHIEHQSHINKLKNNRNDPHVVVDVQV